MKQSFGLDREIRSAESGGIWRNLPVKTGGIGEHCLPATGYYTVGETSVRSEAGLGVCINAGPSSTVEFHHHNFLHPISDVFCQDAVVIPYERQRRKYLGVGMMFAALFCAD